MICELPSLLYLHSKFIFYYALRIVECKLKNKRQLWKWVYEKVGYKSISQSVFQTVFKVVFTFSVLMSRSRLRISAKSAGGKQEKFTFSIVCGCLNLQTGDMVHFSTKCEERIEQIGRTSFSLLTQEPKHGGKASLFWKPVA